jgi:hypothetical protein
MRGVRRGFTEERKGSWFRDHKERKRMYIGIGTVVLIVIIVIIVLALRR